ncbi:hypothetical protein Psfp_03882 [Pelotomaculum sp. FP]|nr:hypothetical protein Psfp_03882 [Pelotomaculum sp. FP]
MHHYKDLNNMIIKNGLKKEYLADKLNVSHNYFYMVLNGRKNLDNGKVKELSDIIYIYNTVRKSLRFAV